MDVLGEVGSLMLGDVKLGFTGHRHDDELGLIDMKGRVYDPAQKRFLTPDPHVPDPLSGQSYNRYSYVTNNPLRYTDPTGFQPAAGDLETQGSGSQPGGGAAAPTPAPRWPVVLTAAWTIVTLKLTGGDEPPPPPPPPTQEEQDGKWTELMKHMGWAKGAAKQLISMLPPVIVARQIRHNIQVARAAVSHAREGDWDLAGAAILEIPQQAAEGAASIVTGPIEAAMEIPDDIQVAIESGVDPEDRGAAAVAAVQNIATVVATAVGVAETLKGTLPATKTSTLQEGPFAGDSIPARGPDRKFTASERAAINEIGQRTGCHTCGSKNPGTASGNFIPDHQPPNQLANGQPQRLYPHCNTCSARQGGQVSAELTRKK